MENPDQEEGGGREEEEEKEKSKEPAGRRGACSFIHNNKFYLYSGYAGGPALTQRSQSELSVLDVTSGCWSTEQTTAAEEDVPKCISGACCTVTNNCLYVFGGWLAGLRNADIHELNLTTLVWRELLAKNPEHGPMLKDKAGMVAYGKRMLCVFGGYGYPSREHISGQAGASYHSDQTSYAQICWTNELHLFNVLTCKSIPSTVCSGSTV